MSLILDVSSILEGEVLIGLGRWGLSSRLGGGLGGNSEDEMAFAVRQIRSGRDYRTGRTRNESL